MPIRDILVTGIVLGTLPFVFRHAYLGVLLWTWLSIMNPHRLTWGFAYSAPFAAMAAGTTLIALFTTKDPVRLPRAPVVRVLIAFILWMWLTTAFAFLPTQSFPDLVQVMKIQFMTLVALAVLHERKHIQLFVWINALSLAFFGVKGGIYTITTGGGGRVWGPGGYIGGNNEVGLAILMAIPLMYYLRLTTENRWIRRGLVAAMLLSTVAVLGTQSRGAFLGLACMAFVMWLRSPHKLLFAIAAAVVAAAALAVMPWTLGDRINSITSYRTDSSAMGRIYAWEKAVNIANDRLFGAGFAMYNRSIHAIYAPRPTEADALDPHKVRAAHSIYFQVLGEHGWVGLILFVTIWILVWRNAGRLRNRARGDPNLQWIFHLAGMCQVALAGYAVGGAFLSLAYYDFPYNLLVTIVVTQRWLAAELDKAAAPVVAPGVADRGVGHLSMATPGGRR